ncbi:MAG: hypothetical protein E7277_04850 [Lachnospiraceae bacterium]|nr:hypothetical protein [Lachnospiraceae bacterium]
MEKYIAYLAEQQEKLSKLEKTIRRNQRYSGHIPEGSLRVSNCQGTPQYYFRGKGEEKERFVRKKEMDMARRIAQHTYDEKLLKQIKKTQNVIKNFMRNYDEQAIEKIYENLCQGRKALVNPRFEIKEECIEKWYRDNMGRQNSYPITKGFMTERGEMVRSKSEKILADLFNSMNIPYQYEPVLWLGGEKIYPDFILFHPRRRTSAFWEHFGLADDDNYAVKNFQRLDSYEREGYQIGETLLFSIETSEKPLNVQLVKKKLEEWIK